MINNKVNPKTIRTDVLFKIDIKVVISKVSKLQMPDEEFASNVEFTLLVF